MAACFVFSLGQGKELGCDSSLLFLPACFAVRSATSCRTIPAWAGIHRKWNIYGGRAPPIFWHSWSVFAVLAVLIRFFGGCLQFLFTIRARAAWLSVKIVTCAQCWDKAARIFLNRAPYSLTGNKRKKEADVGERKMCKCEKYKNVSKKWGHRKIKLFLRLENIS